MNKFLGLCAVFLAFLISTAAAMPQGSAVATHNADNSESGNAHLVQPRQVHNADYGSNNGPSGNPQPAKQTSTEAESPVPTDHDSKPTSGAADDSSKQQKRRDFVPRPSHDINYSDS